jgi:hypothetical protein
MVEEIDTTGAGEIHFEGPIKFHKFTLPFDKLVSAI